MDKDEWEVRQQNIALVEAGNWTNVATFNTYKGSVRGKAALTAIQ